MKLKNKNPTRPITVCYILSYKMPQYVRTQALLAMLDKGDNIRVVTAINSRTGLIRYFETLLQLLAVRFRCHPDIYILGFRGYEIFWPVRILTVGRPLIFDEFINLYLWVVEEHRKVRRDSIASKLIGYASTSMLCLSTKILSDTHSHAEYSSKQSGVDIEKFVPIYVGTNETLFSEVGSHVKKTETFNVFYYGSYFLPLHGMDTLIEAATMLKELPITFTVIGGGNNTATENFKNTIKENKLTNLSYHKRVAYEELRDYASSAQLCLGGPFGKTPQSELVITGKTFQFLSMAKPVVVGHNRETMRTGFTHKKNCLIVPRNDTKALADAIRWCYKNPEELKSIGKSGRVLFEEKFSIKTQSKVLSNTIHAVVNKK